MGTIVDKFNYSFEAKDLIKDSINNLGGSITSETELKEYAQELDNIYDNLPKTTGEGTNLSLTTLKGKMNIIPKGNTEQNGTPTPSTPIDIEVVTGTQEVKVSGNEFAEIETQTLNDMKITKTDNGYILNGTASANTTFRATITNPTNSNKTLCVKCDTAITNANVQVKTRNSSAGQLRSISLSTANEWEVLSGTFEDYYCDIYVKSGTTLSNVLVQPMLLEGTFTTSNLGKYQPYNEEQTQQVSLGDIELCKIGNYQDYLYKTSGKNKFDKTNYEQGYSYTNGSKVANTNWGIYYLTCNANETYTISGLKAYSGAQIVQLDNSKNIISVLQTRTTANTFTITSTQVGYIGISFVWSITPSLGSELDTIMINIGSTALPYEPYGSGIWYKKEYRYNISNKTNWSVDNIASNNRAVVSLAKNGFPYSSDRGYANINAISNCFTGIAQANQVSTTEINNIVVNNANMYIKFADTINTKELAKAQLDSMTSLEVYYVVATPNDIELTDTTLIEQLDNLEKLMSYNGTTNISSSGNLPMILNVSAIKGE